MPVLTAAAARAGNVGAVVVNKGPQVEFPNPSELARRLGCRIIGVVAPATNLNAEALPVSSRYDVHFSRSIKEVARELTAAVPMLA
jgi:hypothetical protein